MSLSKIYRGEEGGEIKEFRFRSFGDTEVIAPPEGGFSQPETVDPAPMVPEAPNNIPQLIEEAHARGRQEGLALAEERFENTIQALTQATEEVCRLRASLAQSGSRDMLRLVMAVAEQIIQRCVEIDPAVVAGIVEKALQASVRADSLRLVINPADLETITERKPLFLASISGLQNLSIETDPSISRGGCRVDSELGDVDATLESQLETIRQTLSEAIQVV